MGGNSPKNLRTENERLASQVEELRLRLEEAEQALEAIRTGQAESLVVEGPNGPRIFSLEGADHSYRVLVEAMNEGAATLGEDGTILYCNTRLAGMLELPLERVMGSAILRFLPDRSRQAFEALVREANGGESRGEVELLGQGGEPVPAYLSVSVINDDTRRRLCLVAADLRAQKRNAEIVAAERLALSVLEQAAEAIVVCDEQGRVIRASSTAAELCGRNPLLTSFDVAFPVKLDVVRAAGCDGSVASCALRGEVLRAAPAWLERSDGARAHLVVSAAPLTSNAGRVIGCVITMTDISERKRAEETLRELNLQLADANRRKNEFLAMLSHELRNPLAPIKNSLYILDRATPGGDQAKRAQSVIDRQVEQLARLVDDLLDVTRISRNKVHLKFERLDVNEVVRRTVEDHRFLFEKGGVHLDTAFAPSPLMVNADWTRIAQVVGNLLTNAAKFTGRGGSAQVSVSGDERLATVRVSDTGAGMSSEMLARLFEPFAQGDRTLDRNKGGLGLGLALVKGLVEMHRGEVSAHSAGPGKGAEFVVRLPLAGDAAVTAPNEPTPVRRVRRILVIEDNVDAADSLREALELCDHEVEVAYDGPDGLAKAREFKPELVLCDIGLPGMDGYEVARAFRSDPELRGAHLVALSGYAMPEDLERAAGAGFERHLAKPPNLETIEQALWGLP
jgi:two-component system CheB/CheR fusion protein